MTSVKVKLKSPAIKGKEGSIFYQIIHNREVKQIFTSYRIFESEWDHSRSRPVIPPDGPRKENLKEIKDNIDYDLQRLYNIIRRFDNSAVLYSVHDIQDAFIRFLTRYSLFTFLETQITGLKRIGKIRTSETYRSALSSFKNFRGGHDIMLDRLDSDILISYQAWLQRRNIAPNTISFYNRILRAAYNRAVDEAGIPNRNPFRNVYTGIARTVKRALPIHIIRRIKTLDLTDSPALDYARDIFILSFMLRGMSFVDMCYLRKQDLSNNHISYRRRKTGQPLTIQWTTEMQRILDKYPANESMYLLPILSHTPGNDRAVYKTKSCAINRNLKKIGLMVGLATPLTLYVARHSWASAAKTKGIPLSIISEGMGHDSETTTRIYLASLDTSAIDHANALILSSI